ncbi:MAG: DUF1189 domain-containing protein [Elusimicrobia bacterium]|nr:DUF1189 domain-containing protein [Elusimicrobiota bacterium]
MIIVDFYKHLFSFKHYTLTAKKSGGYVFLYAVIIFIITFAGGFMLINKYISQIPVFLKSLPPVEVKNAELLINDGQPYKVQIPPQLTRGQTFYAQYNPALEFPPTETDFTNNNTLLIVSKKSFFVFSAGEAKETPFDFKKDFPRTDGAALAQLYSGNQVMQSTIQSAAAVGMLIAAIIMFVYWFVINLLLGFVVNAFMQREVPKNTFPKLAVFVQTPFMVLFLLNIFAVTIPFIALVQLFLSGIYLQQILNNYPKKVQNAA